MSEHKEIVLVTGISGWIAQFCAVELINHGYRVRGSLRSSNRKNEVETAIRKLVDTDGVLDFCELDLMHDTGWNDACKGCTYMLHVASPFELAETKDTDRLIRPAVDGTLRALNAAKAAKLKRVVLTSSIVAMLAHLKEGSCDTSSWTDVNDSSINTYQKSKTLAELAAWDFIQNQTGDHTLELSVINPGAVLGPSLSPDIQGESLNICTELLTGKMPGIPNLNIPMVDVRDVAKHHIQAMSLPEAKNKRYMSCYSEPTPFLEFAQTLKDNGFNVPTKKVPTFMLKILSLFDPKVKGMLPLLDRYVSVDNSSTIQDFNWTPIPLKTTFIDMASSVQSILNQSKSNHPS